MQERGIRVLFSSSPRSELLLGSSASNGTRDSFANSRVRGVKPITHFRLVPRLRMSGAILLPLYISWGGDLISIGASLLPSGSEIYRGIIRWLINNELEAQRGEALVAPFEPSAYRDCYKPRWTSVRLVSVQPRLEPSTFSFWMALQPLWAVTAFQSLDLFTIGRTPWTSD
jgi:hypothetical protein